MKPVCSLAAFGQKHHRLTIMQAIPGNNQTACTVSPYFYEEDNWVDDVELAAAIQYNLTQSPFWLKKADYWGQLEEITTWMELGRARHYQFYPFVNLGHYYLAKSNHPSFITKYRATIHSSKWRRHCATGCWVAIRGELP